MFAHSYEEILKDYAYFWDYDLLGKGSGDRYLKKIQNCLAILKIYLFGLFGSTLIAAVLPFFTDLVTLPVELWIPNNDKMFKSFIWVAEIVVYAEMTMTCGWFDGLFFLIVTDLEIQFQLIMNRLQKIKINNNNQDLCYKELKECFIHHNFLIR